MTDRPSGSSARDDHRRLGWRIVFWLAFLLPLVPSLIIFLIGEIASARGCMTAPLEPCIVGPLSLGLASLRAVRLASGMGTVIGFAVPLVLALAYVGLELGVRSLGLRIVLAFLACLLLAFVPVIGPSLAMEGLVHPGCQPNEGGVGECTLFGVSLGQQANTMVVMGWFFLIAGPLAFLTFLAYLLIALVLRASRRSPAR